MYQTEKLKACLLALMGFRQPERGTQLGPALIGSKTGLYFNDVHPLITIENIEHVVPRENTLDKFLENLVGAAGIKLVEVVFENKKLDRASKTILEDLYLYSNGGNVIDLEIKEGRFVGLEIKPISGKDISTVIHQVGTQFTGANPGFKLYLYKDGQAAPVNVWEYDIDISGGFLWQPLEQAGENKATLNGGTYYLGYYETDLTGQAVRKVHDLSSPPCSTCNSYDIGAWGKWSQQIEVRAFSVAAENLSPVEAQFTGEGIQYTTTSNFGLNLQVSTACDLTDYLCRHSRVLTNALGLQVAVDLLGKIAFTQRENGLSQQAKAQAFMELNNKDNNQAGLVTRLDKAIKVLGFDLSDYNPTCLPCLEAEPEDSVEWGAM